MPLKARELKRNTGYAFAAQLLALGLSVIMSLIVPKLMGVKPFSYWQLFIFYTQYGGFLHLGLNDGVYLRTGGKNYNELDYSLLGSEYKYGIIFQTLICVLICVCSYFFCGSERYLIIVLSCICTLISNSISYFGYILQAVNNTKAFSLSQIYEKAVFIAILLALCFAGKEDYLNIICFYIIARLIALVYCIYKAKEVFFSRILQWIKIKTDLFENVKVGLTLTLSNVASMLILGIGRFMTDANFGIVEFGKLSFAIMITNFFLVFMSQVSLVLFPALRQLNTKELPNLFSKMNATITILSPVLLLCYPLVYIFLTFWLPAYKESLVYLIFLLPLTCYDGKMQMLFNTFLKVSRKELQMLYINAISCILSILLSAIAIYAFHSIVLVALGMLIALMVRSFIAEIYLSRLYNVGHDNNILSFALLCISFVVLFYYCNIWIATLCYLTVFLFYSFKHRKVIYAIANNLKI